jgi:hypothetical protein
MAAGRPGEPDTPATPDEKRDAELAALLVERAGYVARGLDDVCNRLMRKSNCGAGNRHTK